MPIAPEFHPKLLGAGDLLTLCSVLLGPKMEKLMVLRLRHQADSGDHHNEQHQQRG